VQAGATAAEFDRAAPRYDLMVALNPGYHRHLRGAAARLRAVLPAERAVRLVDLGCGSGASTRALIDELGADWIASLIGIDASSGMLARASRKRWPPSVRFTQGSAEHVAALVADLAPQPVDGIFAAYLYRNVADRDGALRAAHAALRPGGGLVVQDYSVAGRTVPTLVWSLVCWLVVVPLALLTSGRATLYRYLWRSVIDFDSVAEFAARLRRAGFDDVEVRTVRGWQRGILHTFSARRGA
jgi:ubiquinone/menaquinone biosynthesis C-methylase UbiE